MISARLALCRPDKLRPVLTGIDVLRADDFAPLRGKRVGLVTNHTGLTRDGATTIDVLFGAKDVKLVALFSPEHGIRGTVDDKVASSTDEKTGLPIHSLYGETRRPTAAMLEGLDALVVDLQDIGARFYTYTTTMAYVLEEAAKSRLPVIVLDRPNPINGFQIEGPRARQGAARVHWLLRADADQARADDRRAGPPLQRREQDRGEPDRDRSEELAARLLVRRDVAPLDQPVAKHAEPDSGDALSRESARSKPRTFRSAAAPTRRSSSSARRGSTRRSWLMRSTGDVFPASGSTRCDSLPRPANTRDRPARVYS